VKCCGKNTYGQLGDGSTEGKSKTVGVFGLESGVLSIDAGTNHTCALMEYGSVERWGYNK
jgi:alpha-tubulin suppressor-like RCC1 family protein